jgi:hypothetical protein
MKLGPIEVAKGLPPEVISRIVRQNFGRFRMCADRAKEARPIGRWAGKIHIAKGGEVSKVDDDGTTLKNQEITQCISQAMLQLSFPEPEGGAIVARVTLDFAH